MIDPLELPLRDPPRDIEFWSENYVFEIGSPDQDMMVFLHLSRQSFDYELWRETMAVQLPGGRIAVVKGYGRGAHPAGPGGPQIRFHCEEAFRRWRVEVAGAARVVPRAALSGTVQSTLEDGPYTAFEMTLECEMRSPAWDIGGAIASHSWGKAHYQQAVCASGEIVVDGERIAFEGVGMRDHTRGPRNFATLGPWLWTSAGTAAGAHFIVLAMNPAAGTAQPPVRVAMMAENGALFEVTVKDLDVFGRADGRVAFALERPDGRVDTIVGQRGDLTLMTPGAPNQLLIGPAQGAAMYSSGSHARFDWNGTSAAGYVELGIPPDLLRQNIPRG